MIIERTIENVWLIFSPILGNSCFKCIYLPETALRKTQSICFYKTSDRVIGYIFFSALSTTCLP